MESLQTIAEQCLPETWETDTEFIADNSQGTYLDLDSLHKCQFCGENFRGIYPKYLNS